MTEGNILYYFVPKEILCQIFSQYLSVHDISNLDIAVCNNTKRIGFLKIIGSSACIWHGDENKKFGYKGIFWLNSRNMKIRRIKCNRIPANRLTCSHDNIADDMAKKIAGFGIYLECLSIDKQFDSDISIIQIAEGCPNIEQLCIKSCKNITDYSIIKLAESCRNMKEFEILCEDSITDTGISKLA
jgi:hypothetical protein